MNGSPALILLNVPVERVGAGPSRLSWQDCLL